MNISQQNQVARKCMEMGKKDFDKNKTGTPGECPQCGSEDLDYECSDSMDDFVKYPFTCCKCGYEDAEWYELKFVGHNE